MNSIWVLCFGGVFVVLLLIVGAVIALYNRVIVLRNRVENAWAQIDVQLKLRYDLIPNLVATVKGYAAHEANTLEAVIKARQVAIDAQGVAEQAQAENALTSTLRSLFAVAEAYPDLKANTNFLQLQQELTNVEQKVGYARQFYNDSVTNFNQAIQVFPANLIAGIFGFTARDYFEIQAAEKEAPKVEF